MKVTKVFLLIHLVLFAGLSFLFAQNDPDREILVYFTSGVERMPRGQPALITSPE